MFYQPTPPIRTFGPYVTLDVNIAGNDKLVIVPGWIKGIPQYWCLKNLYLILNTDATVANRYITFETYKNVLETNLVEGYIGPAIAASVTNASFQIGRVGLVTGIASFNCQANWSFFRDMEFYGDQVFKIAVANGVIGDNLLGVLVLKYLNYELGVPAPDNLNPWGIEPKQVIDA